MNPRVLRRHFLRALVKELRVVWPIPSLLILLIAGLGLLVGVREGWTFQESEYFGFVTGLTIGYGDFSPKTLLGRILAIFIGACGVLLTALLAAVAVKALTATEAEENGMQGSAEAK
jgi:hypothetical protein